MIYRLLADLYKTVKIHHDNTEVKQSDVVLMYRSTIQLLQLGQIILDTKFRNSALARDGNRGNCVMRTRIRKPGSTFFPCIPYKCKIFAEACMKYLDPINATLS